MPQQNPAVFTPAYFFNDKHRPEAYEVIWEAVRMKDGRVWEWQAVIRTADEGLLYGWYDLSDSNRVNWSRTAEGRQAPTGEGWESLNEGHHITSAGICAVCTTIPCRNP